MTERRARSVIREPVTPVQRALLACRPDAGGVVLFISACLCTIGAAVCFLGAVLSPDPLALAAGAFAVAATTQWGLLAWATEAESRLCVPIVRTMAMDYIDKAVEEWRLLPSGLRAETLPLLRSSYEAARIAGLAPDDESLRRRAAQPYMTMRKIRQLHDQIQARSADVGIDPAVEEAKATLATLRAGLAAIDTPRLAIEDVTHGI